MTWRPSIFHSRIDPSWIDYNGHLRDAYYSLILSLAIDALMDQIGMDARYRARTACTLYTLEMHMHFLNEVKESDVLGVAIRLIDSDAKRMHLGFAIDCPRHADPVAHAEFMLLHVHQGASPKSAPFPAEVTARLQAWHESQVDATNAPPGSRKMELGRRS